MAVYTDLNQALEIPLERTKLLPSEVGDKKLVAFTGYCRSGKDSFGASLAKEINKTLPSLKTEIFSFANAVRKEIDSFLQENFGISAWTEDATEKTLIRPFLIAHGNARRSQSENTYWIAKLSKDISQSNCDVAIITDLRFAQDENDELGWFNKNGGLHFHIRRFSKNKNRAIYEKAPNEFEKENEPKLIANAAKTIILERIEKDVDYYRSVDEIVRDLVVDNFNFFNS